MKKVSFFVALFAIAQIAMGQRFVQAQQRLTGDRHAVEETLGTAGQPAEQELEQLFEELGISAEKLSRTLERFAEEHAQELDNWSTKYSQQWESWGNRFEQKIERLAKEQEGIWRQWSDRYEQNLTHWAADLESDELAPEHLGEFVERNLQMLSEMPLGQMVDQVLEEGVGELGDAPWESLEELGALAQKTLEEPIGEIADALGENSDARRALEKSANELEAKYRRLRGDQSSNRSDAHSRLDRIADPNSDPRISALLKLSQRKDATPAQRERIDQLIRMYRDADQVKRNETQQDRRRVDIPSGDPIKRKIDREQSRQDLLLKQFNDDLNRSSEESRRTDAKTRESENRRTKRVDGKNLDSNSRGNQKSDRNPLNRPRDGRTPKTASGQNSNRDSQQKAQRDRTDTELDLLRQELKKLREEVKRLKESDR